VGFVLHDSRGSVKSEKNERILGQVFQTRTREFQENAEHLVMMVTTNMQSRTTALTLSYTFFTCASTD
jgi:hypothetical protein